MVKVVNENNFIDDCTSRIYERRIKSYYKGEHSASLAGWKVPE